MPPNYLGAKDVERDTETARSGPIATGHDRSQRSRARCSPYHYSPPAAHAFSISKWEAGTCRASNCTDAGPDSAFYTQAAGHPDFGITDFAFDSKEAGVVKKWKEPEGHVKDVRVDLPPGLAVNPEATSQLCTEEQLNSDNRECPAESQVGEDEATGTAEIALGVKETVTEHFPVYNMVRKPGEPSRFGVEIASPTLALLGLQGHVYLEGGISWQGEAETSETSGVTSGDYHEFFKIQNIPQQPEIVESRLIFWGVPQSHSGSGQPDGVHHPAEHLLEQADHPPARRLLRRPRPFPAERQTKPRVTATGCDQLAFDPRCR